MKNYFKLIALLSVLFVMSGCCSYTTAGAPIQRPRHNSEPSPMSPKPEIQKSLSVNPAPPVDNHLLYLQSK
ncbi:MAG: hypothetical protein IJZ59_04995 [Alphaproteobacteria bacterium]|nr:hypothetical protein [Alphaproteobacteria bacterium]